MIFLSQVCHVWVSFRTQFYQENPKVLFLPAAEPAQKKTSPLHLNSAFKTFKPWENRNLAFDVTVIALPKVNSQCNHEPPPEMHFYCNLKLTWPCLNFIWRRDEVIKVEGGGRKEVQAWNKISGDKSCPSSKGKVGAGGWKQYLIVTKLKVTWK